MRKHIVETMVNTVEKLAEDSRLSEEEYRFALALLMMEQMQRQNNNPMKIVMAEDMALSIGLIIDDMPEPRTTSKDYVSVH